MLEDVKKRLEWIGYTYVKTDEDFLNYLIKKVSNDVQVFCNITKIPDELHCYVIDRVTGEFLLNKKDSGSLNMDSIDFEGIAKSLQMGDTKVEIAVENVKSPEQRFDALINYLVTSKKELLVSFRQLRW